MNTSNLTWEEKVCCYFLREICDWLCLKVLGDPRRKCLIIKNNRIDDDMAEYLGEENGEREGYDNLLEVYEAIRDRGYTSNINAYLEINDGLEGDARLQWCKLAKQFLENTIIIDILDNITFQRLYSPRYAYEFFNLGDVQKLLRDITIRDKRYLYIG